MDQSTQSLDRDEFARWVRDALNRLYDSVYLQTHPLTNKLVTAATDTHHRSQHLRRVLLDAIRSMRPGSDIPADSPDWRVYDLLELRFIEGLGPAEAMNELALGKTQYYHEQARALEALTSRLWNRWQQQGKQTPAPLENADDLSREDLAQLETERLSAQATWEAVDAVQLLSGLQTMIDSLARVRNVSVQFDLAHPLTILRADRVILRQTILNVVTYALDIADGERITIRTVAGEQQAGIHIHTQTTHAAMPAQDVELDICRQFMTAMGGIVRLEMKDNQQWLASLLWPTSTSQVLLVVDDNQRVIELFRRYLATHNWQVVGAVDSASARQIIAETRPTVIALDVMMPREDGWEFLMSLKQSLDTRDIPVIICSVLNQPQLAEELGAVTYLPKPVTQTMLLQALIPWSQIGASPGPVQ